MITDATVHMLPNQLRDRLQRAADAADHAVSDVCGWSAPLFRALIAIEDAWQSPGAVRTSFVDGLHDARDMLAVGLRTQAQECHHRVDQEKEPFLDADDPHDGWKTSGHLIDTRAFSHRGW